MSERCETDKTPQAKANATDKFNSIARHNQRHCLFDNAATTNQAIFSAIFNSLLAANDPKAHTTIVDIREKLLTITEKNIADPTSRENFANAVTDRLLDHHDKGQSVEQLVQPPPPKIDRDPNDRGR